MEKYNKYKDSGIGWLGDIPEHWKIMRLKDITNLQFSNVDKKVKEDQKDVLLCNYVDVYKNDFIDSSIKFMHSTASESEIKRFGLEIGDIMFTKDSESFDDIANSAVVVENLDNVVCGYHLAHVRANEKFIVPNYLSKLFHSVDYNYWFRINATGITRVGIGIGAIKNSNTFLPPLKEQTQIAKYLDTKTTAIDKKVNLLQQKIKHYKAYRKTLINETVTKGLDKTVKLKDSGINWIGEIPEHWESFRFIDNVYLRHGYQFRDFDFTDEGVKIVKISQLNPNGNLDLSKSSFINARRLKYFNSIRVYQDDILMALTGGTIGKTIRVGKIEEPILQNYRVGNFFTNKKKLNKTFLYFLLTSQIAIEQINYLLNRNGQPNIGKESFKNMFFTLPPLKEQQQIADYLDAKTRTIDKIVKNIETQITTLKELRKTLINEVVTGKVKVSA